MTNVSRRPGTLTASAVLLLIFGGYRIIGSLCGGLAMLLMPFLGELQKLAPPPQGMPKQEDIITVISREEPSYLPVMIIFGICNLLLGIMGLTAGIGLLKRRPGARKLGMFVALACLSMAVVEAIYTGIFILPITNRFTEQQMQAVPQMGVLADIMKGSALIGMVFGLIFSFALWLTVFFLLTNQNVRDYLASDFTTQEPPDRAPSPYVGYDDEDDLPPRRPPDTGISDRPPPR